MIDYWTHTACLDSFVGALAGGVGQPELRDRLVPAASAHREAATLGALVDHLVWHSDSDAELGLVRQASALWNKAVGVYATVTAARGEIEAALIDPNNPASVARFNGAVGQLGDLHGELAALQSQISGLHQALAPIPYVRPPHPRQLSLDISAWPYADRFLARRTAAFIRELVVSSPDDPAMAFSAGAVASYVGNSFGSAYLGTVVGGPRRLHRVRDRLARNTVGAWLHHHRGLPALTQIADMISFGAAPGGEALPLSIRQTLQDALSATYPGMPPHSDLDVGLRRMTEHLRLLDSFVMPAPPSPLGPQLGATLTLTPGSPGGGVKPQSYGDDPHAPAGSTTNPSSSDHQTGSGGGCVAIFAAVVAFLIAGLIICIGLIISEGKCTAEKVWDMLAEGFTSEDPPADATAQTLVAAAGSGAGAELVQEFYKAQGALWQGLSQARTFLATIGLIYPSPTQLGTPLFAQFTSTPNIGAGQWPHSEPPNQFDTYIYAPTTPVEAPSEVNPTPANTDPGYVAERAPAVIADMLGQFFDEPNNLDLDADRRLFHECWDLQAGSHITDQPLSVRVLAYNEV